MVDFYCSALVVSRKPITVTSEHCISLHLNTMENTLAICLYATAPGIVQRAHILDFAVVLQLGLSLLLSAQTCDLCLYSICKYTVWENRLIWLFCMSLPF